MTILYLHGLDSKLSPEKQRVLEKYAKVIAPEIDYRTRPDVISELLGDYKNSDVVCVIGSSMGGFVAYHVSQAINVPALLFNPAFPYRSVQINVPGEILRSAAYLRIVIGGVDDVIIAEDNLTYIEQHVESHNLELIFKPDLGHQIPVDVFEPAIADFMKSFQNIGS